MKTVSFALTLFIAGLAALRADGEAEVVAYLESCRKPNGAFGPIDQAYTDAAWNFPAVAALHALGREIKQPESILANGLGYPKGHVGHGHWRFFHQHQIRHLLAAPMKTKHSKIRVVHQGFEVRYYGSPFGTGGETFFNAGGEPHPDPRDVDAEELGFYNFSSLYYLLAGLGASGREASNRDELVDYIFAREAPDGGFVDVRVEGRKATNPELSLPSIFFAIAILDLLGEPIPNPRKCANYLRRELAKSNDIYEIHIALRALEILGEEADSRSEIAKTIRLMRNADGGFGDRAGWRSRLYSTFWAVDSLRILKAEIGPVPTDDQTMEPIEEDQFQIFQALMKTPAISPNEFAGLHERGLNLLGLKSENAALVTELRAAISDQQLPMDIVLCPEFYPHRAPRPGGLVLHHVLNATIDPGADFESRLARLNENGTAEMDLWNDYDKRVIWNCASSGLAYPEQDFEMDLAFDAYDRSYNAFLAGFNWAPSDFVRVFPWRERFVGRFAAIADADAHGDLEKWSEHLDFTRNLYLAEDSSYTSFLDAARNGRLVCVIAPRDGEAAAFYGSEPAVEFVKARIDEWRWW
ncbi:MAG: prenyltransferase beta subunit [Verrucomicrobiales bacterium]|jgi:prenyltransferase beta subunit